MASLPCDECGGYTGVQGSWDTPLKIVCAECSKPIFEEDEKRNQKITV